MIPHRVLFDEKSVQARVRELAKKISLDLQGRSPVLLGLLRGSFIFLADLVRELSRLGVEPKVDFLSVSHYAPEKVPAGAANIERGTTLDLSGIPVILVDDILDTGESLAAALNHLKKLGPSWLRVCVFLDKPARRTVPIHVDYVGFQVPDVWIIGYGLDLNDEGRALPYIGAVKEN